MQASCMNDVILGVEGLFSARAHLSLVVQGKSYVLNGKP